MASVIVDLTLDDGYRYTQPGTPERATLVRELIAEAGCDPTRVRFRVLNEHGPAGGNPECEVSGPKSEVWRFIEWYVENMFEPGKCPPDEAREWAEEFWTDQSDSTDVTDWNVVSVEYAEGDRCPTCGRIRDESDFLQA